LPESDYKGWAIQGGLSYALDPAIALRVSGAYGSGNKGSESVADKDTDAFVTHLGNDQHYTLIYEYNVVAASGALNTGLENTWYGNIGVDWQATKELGLSLDGYYLQASEENFLIRDKDIGWEIDAKLKYALAKNLTYQIDAGYFDAGDMYKFGPANFDPKGVTLLRHAITLTF